MEPPPRDAPSTVAMVVLESGYYYQVRITPRPPDNHWDLEAAASMLPRQVELPNGPTPLLSGQPPDLLTAIGGVTGAQRATRPYTRRPQPTVLRKATSDRCAHK